MIELVIIFMTLGQFFFKLHFCEDLFTIFCAYAFIDGQPGSALADVVQISGQGSDL